MSGALGRPLAMLAALAITLLIATSSAAACVTVGVYQDNPTASLASLDRQVGPGITAISVYLTAGRPLAQSVITTANKLHARLIVNWQPDNGRNGANQPKYRLSAVVKGRYDSSLRALVAQLLTVKRGAILRPMPEMNTPWYPWSGTVNGQSAEPVTSRPGSTCARRCARPRAGGGSSCCGRRTCGASRRPRRTPSRRTSPAPRRSTSSAPAATTSAAQAPLTWTDARRPVRDAHTRRSRRSAKKPFWIAETGSTAQSAAIRPAGSSRSATLQATAMPKLAGVVWYDVKDPTRRLPPARDAGAPGVQVAAQGGMPMRGRLPQSEARDRQQPPRAATSATAARASGKLRRHRLHGRPGPRGRPRRRGARRR